MFRIPGTNILPNAYSQTYNEMAFGYGSPSSLNYKQAKFTTTDTGVLEFVTRGPALTGMWVDWGDGSREWIQHTGVSNNITTNHDYDGLVGTKNVVLSGILSEVTYLICSDSFFTGNIASFKTMKSLTVLNLTNAQIGGTLSSALPYLTKMEELSLRNTGITGTTSDLSILTNATALGFQDTALTGPVSDLAGLTLLYNTDFNDSLVSGDIADIATLVNLAYTRFANTSVGYTTATLPAWAGNIQFQDCNWTQAEVDAFLIDLEAAGGSNGTLNIAGNNAVHSAASNAAIDALNFRSWNLTLSV